MKLSALFSEGMVLQRGKKNRLWGCTEPEKEVKGSFGGVAFGSLADENGRFELILPELSAGGPYELSIQAEEERRIKKVYVGDVFLLGGQSNMELPLDRTLELYREELADVSEECIRFFEVPKEYDFDMEREEIETGYWRKAEGKELLTFSAAGYFTAKELKERYAVPIGLIQTAVGGTPAKAWCSEESTRKLGWYTKELKQCRVPEYVKSVEAKEAKREQNWRDTGRKSFSGTAIKKGSVTIPGLWESNELAGFHGAIRLTKQFTLTKEQAEQELELVLGAIVDADCVYVNGVFAGETGYCYPPRFYPIPEGILKEGENTVEIQMFVFRGAGGFMPGKKYGIRKLRGKKLELALAGTWDYEIMREMNVLPETTFFTYKATGLYYGMLKPIRKWNICAFLYYQGESDTDHPERYAREMEALIYDWRALWEESEMPFIYVSLAGFSDGELFNQGENWAKLRSAQEEGLKVPNTAMVAAYDIGEYNDLHPMNKKTLGKRLSFAVRKLVYKEDVVCAGPVAKEVHLLSEDSLSIEFETHGKGLCAGNTNEVFEVQLADESGAFKDARAVICGDKLVVSADKIKKITGVRYAWRDCPMEANLYNKEGLPANPFLRTWKDEQDV